MGKRDRSMGSANPSTSASSEFDRPNKQTKVQKNSNGDDFVRAAVPHALRHEDLRTANRHSMPRRGVSKEGHLVCYPGDNISPRFKILVQMGEGTFGKVYECWDRHTKEYVAIKVVRGLRKYKHAAMIELEVLESLKANDPGRTRHNVLLRDWFMYRGHVCMVFERLGPSLFDFIRKNGYKGFPLAIVQSFARQMLESVSFLADMNLCHTDLKPENVLCAHPEYSKVQLMGKDRFGRRVPRSSKIKVIDFGSATFEDQYHSKIISTRHYRAPEVILGIKWSYGCDVWSLGCIFAEILTGEALYQTHENLEHLAMIERTCGRFPTWMVRAAEDQSWFDREKGLVRWGGSSRSHRAVMRLSRVHSMIRAVNEGSSTEPRALEAFADLVGKMLAIDPKERISAKEALRHEFFSMSVRLPESCKGLCSIDDVRPAARSETRGRRSERSDREGDRRASGERDGEQKHAGAKRKAEESKEGDGDQWSQPPDKQGRMGSAVDVGA